MKKYVLSVIIFIASIRLSFAQQDSLTNSANYIIYPSDSLPVVELDSIILLPKLKFSNFKEIKHYKWLQRRVYKVYPFAKLSGENIIKLDKRLNKMKSKRQKKRYIRIIKNWIKKELEPELKNLTQSEGRILSKLFHRQTGQTVFEFLKKYKSSWTAFWYQNMAKLYNIDLKVKFDPINNKDDYWIEYILQEAFIYDVLEKQPNKLGFKFINLQNKWKPKTIPIQDRLKQIKLKTKK